MSKCAKLRGCRGIHFVRQIVKSPLDCIYSDYIYSIITIYILNCSNKW